MTAGEGTYNEVVVDTPVTVTPTTTPVSIFPGISYKWVTSIVIRERSVGTSTYVAIGNSVAQNYRLTGIGSIFQFSANPGEVFDAAKIWVSSDTADAAIEIVATYLPVSLYGNVNLAIGQR